MCEGLKLMQTREEIEVYIEEQARLGTPGFAALAESIRKINAKRPKFDYSEIYISPEAMEGIKNWSCRYEDDGTFWYERSE